MLKVLKTLKNYQSKFMTVPTFLHNLRQCYQKGFLPIKKRESGIEIMFTVQMIGRLVDR